MSPKIGPRGRTHAGFPEWRMQHNALFTLAESLHPGDRKEGPCLAGGRGGGAGGGLLQAAAGDEAGECAREGIVDVQGRCLALLRGCVLLCKDLRHRGRGRRLSQVHVCVASLMVNGNPRLDTTILLFFLGHEPLGNEEDWRPGVHICLNAKCF